MTVEADVPQAAAVERLARPTAPAVSAAAARRAEP